MKFSVLVFCLYVDVSLCEDPATSHSATTILRSLIQNDGSGNYHFEYEGSDGQKRIETGELKKLEGDEDAWISVMGSYSYIGSDGKNYTVEYIADKGGYRPIISIDGFGNDLDSSLSLNSDSSFAVQKPSSVTEGSLISRDVAGNSIDISNSSEDSSLTTDMAVDTLSSISVTEIANTTDVSNSTDVELSKEYSSQSEESSRSYIPPKLPIEQFIPEASEINGMAYNSPRPFSLATIMQSMKPKLDELGDNDLIKYILAYKSQ